MTPPPSTIDDLQKLSKESRENIDRAMQEIATLENLLKLIEQIPTDKKGAQITLPVLTSMTKRLENLRKESEKNELLRQRVEDAALKIFELCISIPEVHDHLTSATMQEKLEDTDERLQIIDQAFGLIVLYPEQAAMAGIQTQEHRKALVNVLLDPKVQSMLCGRILASENPMTEINEHRNCALRFLVLVFKRQEELLPEKKLRDDFANRSVKEWLSYIRSFALNAYEAAFLFSKGKIGKDDMSKKLRDNPSGTDDDWRMSLSEEGIRQLSAVNAIFFEEAESIARDILKKIFPNIEKKTDEKEDPGDIVGKLLKILMFLGPAAGYCVSIMRLKAHTNLMKEFKELRDMLPPKNLNLPEISRRAEKLAKKFKLKSDDIIVMVSSDQFMDKIVGSAFVNKPDGKIKTILSLFNVYPFTLRYRGPYAQISFQRFKLITSLLQQFEYPKPAAITADDLLSQRSGAHIVDYLSNPSIKVDPRTGRIDLGPGSNPIIPRRR